MLEPQLNFHDSFKHLPKISVGSGTCVTEPVSPLNINDFYKREEVTPPHSASVTSVTITSDTPSKEVGVIEINSYKVRENKDFLSVGLPITPATPYFFDEDTQSSKYEYEERMAISEYDGLQSPAQAQRVAYLQVFPSAFIAIIHEDAEVKHKGDWFEQKILSVKEYLSFQGINLPH